MRTLRCVLLALLLLLSGSSIAFGDAFQDGVDAVEKGDYNTAYIIFLPLAERGDARAQCNLGVMYDNGLGVPKDYKEASKWFRLAAEQGDPYAQHNLGGMYDQGQGVVQDHVLAYMWFTLSGSQGIQSAIFNRRKCAEKMSPAQIDEAREMAVSWKPKNLV
jgi:TPR repeat protein